MSYFSSFRVIICNEKVKTKWRKEKKRVRKNKRNKTEKNKLQFWKEKLNTITILLNCYNIFVVLSLLRMLMHWQEKQKQKNKKRRIKYYCIDNKSVRVALEKAMKKIHLYLMALVALSASRPNCILQLCQVYYSFLKNLRRISLCISI